MAGVSINMLSNVREAVRGVDSVADAVEDVEGRLRDLTKEGDSATDRMEADFRSVARSADRASDELKAKFRDAYQSVRRNSDEAADDVVRSQRKISERSAEVGQEVRQNLGEGIANAARGDFESLADTIGDTFGGAVAGIGGVASAGLAAAGALGIGALVAALSTAQEKLAGARERAVELASTMYENKGQIPLAARAQELITLLGSERLGNNVIENVASSFLDLGTNLDMVRWAAGRSRPMVEQLITALSGSDLEKSKQALADINAEYDRLMQRQGSDFGEDEARRQQALESVRSELEKVIEASELADALYKSTDFLNAQRVDELSAAWQNAATDASNYFKQTEDGATSFDWSSYLADAEATIAASDEMKRRLVGLPEDIRAEAERVFSTQGAVAANEYTKAYEAASVADKARFESAARANGEAAGQAQAQGLKNAFGNPVINATLKVGVDDSAWRNFSPSPKTGWIRGVPQPV